MRIFNDENLLEMVELYAAEVGAIDSEQDLSDRFDADVLPAVIDAYSEDDQDAIDQSFNDWADGLCKDGEIHAEQYSNYCYVGKLS